MSAKLVKVVSCDGGLTEELLKEIRELSVVAGERDPRKSRVKFITNLLETGQFNRCEWAECFCKETGKTYRVNGQVTSKLLQDIVDNGEGKPNAEFPIGIPVVRSYYICDTIIELLEIFDEFDHHKSARTSLDRLGIYLCQRDDMNGIERLFCNRILSGISWGYNNIADIEKVIPIGYVPNDSYDRGTFLGINKVRSFIIFMYKFSNTTFRKWAIKPGMIARLFSLFLYNNGKYVEIIVSEMTHEIGNKSTEFVKMIRKECKRTGVQQGTYYQITDEFCSSRVRSLKRLDKKEFELVLTEVRDKIDKL